MASDDLVMSTLEQNRSYMTKQTLPTICLWILVENTEQLENSLENPNFAHQKPFFSPKNSQRKHPGSRNSQNSNDPPLQHADPLDLCRALERGGNQSVSISIAFHSNNRYMAHRLG